MNLVDFEEQSLLSAKIRLKKLFENRFLSLTQKIIKWRLFVRMKSSNLEVEIS